MISSYAYVALTRNVALIRIHAEYQVTADIYRSFAHERSTETRISHVLNVITLRHSMLSIHAGDGPRLDIYVNHTKQGSNEKLPLNPMDATLSSFVDIAPTNVAVGQSLSSADEAFSGNISGIAVFDRILNRAELRHLMILFTGNVQPAGLTFFLHASPRS